MHTQLKYDLMIAVPAMIIAAILGAYAIANI
jgi:hypothetical protein